MNALNALAWGLNIYVVLTYFMMVRGQWSEFRFDVANALGFIPTALINIMAGVYPPLVLTISFGLIGCYGTAKELWRRHGPEAIRVDAFPATYTEAFLNGEASWYANDYEEELA